MMDYGTLRGLVALLILGLFIIIVVWSYSKKRKDSFDDVANSIFDDEVNTANKKRSIDKNNKQETNNNV